MRSLGIVRPSIVAWLRRGAGAPTPSAIAEEIAKILRVRALGAAS